MLLKKRIHENVNVYDCPDLEGGIHTDDPLIARETEMLVKMTVNRMPPKRRLVYRLSRYEHKTNEEISRELAISKKMVEKHLRDSLAEIREVLKFIVIFLG